MRKTPLILALGLLGGSLPSTAMADVFVHGSMTKDKDVRVIEKIDIDKAIIIEGRVERELLSAAEALAIANVRNNNNFLGRDRGRNASQPLGDLNPLDGHIQLEANMTASVGTNSNNGNHGFVGVNQDVGVGVNQGNLVAFAFTDEEEAFTNAEASADQKTYLNEIRLGPTELPLLFATHYTQSTARIVGSINWNTGIVGVNQNSGFFNNQTNGLSVAAAVDLADDCECVIALAEADLGQETTNNTIQEVDGRHRSRTLGSVNNNTGVTLVNQSSGMVGNQGNIYAVDAAITSQFFNQTP